MGKANRIQRCTWLFPALIVLTQIIVLIISPEERTLGTGIKPVYLHVSLTWTGMVLLLFSGIIGLLVAITAKENLAIWLSLIFSTAFGLYGTGFLVSMYASYINWGSVPVGEPQALTTLNILVVSTVSWILMKWVYPIRVRALLSAVPVVFMAWSVKSSRMALHPDNPVNSSPAGIKNTFYIMFFLAILLAVWIMSYLRRKNNFKYIQQVE